MSPAERLPRSRASAAQDGNVPVPMGEGGLVLEGGAWATMVAHCLSTYPEEGCGLLVGPPDGSAAIRSVPTPNVAASGRVYTVDPRSYLRADREAEAEGLAVIGVFHSHTHTDAYPSPTDVAQAPDPSWHYVLVSLRDEVAGVRSYRIVDGTISEEPVWPGGRVPGGVG